MVISGSFPDMSPPNILKPDHKHIWRFVLRKRQVSVVLLLWLVLMLTCKICGQADVARSMSTGFVYMFRLANILCLLSSVCLLSCLFPGLANIWYIVSLMFNIILLHILVPINRLRIFLYFYTKYSRPYTINICSWYHLYLT